MDFQTASFIGLATFGSVHIVNLLFKKKFDNELESEYKIVLSGILAFLFAFVPVELGNVIAERAKDAIAVAVSLNGAYQFTSGVARKINGK